MCNEWQRSFEAFFADMGERPDGLTLERKDNNGPYSKQNCEWATQTAQGRNRRNNHLVVVEGVQMSLAAAVEKYGVTRSAAKGRLSRGWSAERAFGVPTSA